MTKHLSIGEAVDAERKHGAARERARIRRLIGPALRELKKYQCDGSEVDCATCILVRSIRAATRPEPKREKAKGTK